MTVMRIQLLSECTKQNKQICISKPWQCVNLFEPVTRISCSTIKNTLFATNSKKQQINYFFFYPKNHRNDKCS